MRVSVLSKVLLLISFVAFMVCHVGGPILLANSAVINSVLGVETSTSSGANGGMYYDTKYNSVAELRKASEDIIEETMKEGAVLLKNENGALPLSKGDNVTMYGMASYYNVYTGQGSSGVEDGALDDDITVSLYEGLTGAGLNVNESLYNWYGQQSVADIMGGANFSGGSTQTSRFVVQDINWSGLPDAKNNSAKAGIMVLARNSGEAADLYMDVTMDDGSTHVQLSGKNTNENYVGDALSLTENEKSVLQGLKALKDAGTIDSIIVIMNCASPLQSAFLDDPQYDIDACMWVGTIGSTGATAIGKLLVGDYNPSGKLTDTFFAESKYNPVYYNFGSIEYGNSDILADYFATNGIYNNKYYVVYQEGIYNGYKYTETRYEDYVMGRENVGNFSYDTVVSYPFGYGLSYSSFEYSNMQVTDNGDKTYTVTVDVTNTSGVTGKEAVQIYVQKPYTAKDIQNGVEKASVDLVGFTKVEVPAGETVTATVTVEEKYFAAYDANVEKTYVIGSEDESDKYLITAAKDAHDAINNILMYKAGLSMSVDTSKMCSSAGRGEGDADLVWGKYIAYDAVTYSTNEFIEQENANFVADYEGQEANYGVDKITNQFDDTDFQLSPYFSESETNQNYISRSNWTGTYGIRIILTATDGLVEAQKNPAVEKDNVAYPTYDEIAFYESATEFDEIKLIYLRGKDYNDPLWDTLLNRLTWEDMCNLLQEGLRLTNSADSIAAPSTSQQNGALAPVHARTYDSLPSQSGFRGFSEIKDPENKGNKLPVFVSNGIVAATYNTELIERLGEQTGEEAIWAGFNGIYGLGVNIHRGAYCGRTYEYYSEDGFLTGVAAGYEAVGLHKLGVFVLMKHAVLNDQETRRGGINVWANEQTIREIYARAIEVAIEIERENIDTPMLGVMTGMNRLGATWTGGQGFCNTVLRAEFGMRGFAISDYNSTRPYMSTVQGVLYGNDLPDGTPAGALKGLDYDGNDLRFENYSSGYGELAWAMRTSAKNILYTVVNSNAMNGISGDTEITTVTPTWQLVLSVATRTSKTIFYWGIGLFAVSFVNDVLLRRRFW